MLRWSDNVQPPKLLSPDAFNPATRAYPYDNTSPIDETVSVPSIQVNDSSVTFIGQRGPTNEYGVNGCQIDDILTFALGTLQTFNAKLPCRENSIAITKLQECLHCLAARTRDRKDRGVEGEYKR